MNATADASRWRWHEGAVWLVALAAVFVVPSRALLLNEIAILALFALSLDLILGYAGIVSLGHAAFFGFGAYVAALFAKHVMPDPIIGLLVASTSAALLGLVTSFLVMRGSDLTRLMITLGVAAILFELANKLAWLTGGADGLQGMEIGKLFGVFAFDLYGRTAYLYSLATLAVFFFVARHIAHSPFGVSLEAIRDNRLRAAALGISVNARLAAVYTIAAGFAGAAGALLAQTTNFASLDVLAFHRSAEVLLVLVIGGAGTLYGGLYGAIVFKLLQNALSSWTPQYWSFWLGLILVALVLIGRDRLLHPQRWFTRRHAA